MNVSGNMLPSFIETGTRKIFSLKVGIVGRLSKDADDAEDDA